MVVVVGLQAPGTTTPNLASTSVFAECKFHLPACCQKVD